MEWAACDGEVWLLQSLRSAADRRAAPVMRMPVDGLRVPGRPAAPGIGAGPLVACWPHETRAKECRGAIVLVNRPVAALAPLLFGARGVIARAGAASSHLAEVARSLGVPMVVGCHHEAVTGPYPAAGAWFATINGTTGEVVLARLVGFGIVAEVGALADRVHALLGDDLIEWAACDGEVWLLQSLRSAPDRRAGPVVPMPVDGLRVEGRPAAPGIGAGPLVACWPHETRAKDCRGAIVLVDRPVPALAPLLFGARGVIARAGAASSHLAEVARSLGVPMVVGCRHETVTGPRPAAGAWFATINGATGEVVLAPA